MKTASRSRLTLVALTGFGCFMAGVILSNFAHLAACPLCILQRMLYLSLGLVALLSLIWSTGRGARYVSGLLLLAGSALGAFIAGYQSWLQHHPAAASCTADSPWWETFVSWAGDHLPALFQSSGMCSDPGFILFGLSIAEYSAIIFSGLALISASLLRRR